MRFFSFCYLCNSLPRWGCANLNSLLSANPFIRLVKMKNTPAPAWNRIDSVNFHVIVNIFILSKHFHLANRTPMHYKPEIACNGECKWHKLSITKQVGYWSRSHQTINCNTWQFYLDFFDPPPVNTLEIFTDKCHFFYEHVPVCIYNF